MATVIEIPAGGADLTDANPTTIYAASAATGVLGTALDNVRINCMHATQAGAISVWIDDGTNAGIKARLANPVWLAPMTASQAGDGGLDLGTLRLAPGWRLRAQTSGAGLFNVSYLGGIQRSN